MPRVDYTVTERLLLNERVLFTLMRRLIDDVRASVGLSPLEPGALLALLREIVRAEMQDGDTSRSPQGDAPCS